MQNTPVRLRGHHFLCLLSYKGEGYSPQFKDHTASLIRRINRGENRLIITVGADHLCRACPKGQTESCLSESMLRFDALALGTLNRYIKLPSDWSIGNRVMLDPITVSDLRTAFRDGAFALLCSNCTWKNVCSSVAESQFRDALLYKPRPKSLAATGLAACLP